MTADLTAMNTYKNVIHAIPDASLLADLDLRITSVNTAFIELFGYEAEEVLGSTPEFLEANENFPSGFWKPADGEIGDDAENASIRYRTKGGETINCLSRKVALTETDGERLGYLGILTPELDDKIQDRSDHSVPKPAAILRRAAKSNNLMPLLIEKLAEAAGVEGALVFTVQPSSHQIEVILSWGRWERWSSDDLAKLTSATRTAATSGAHWVAPDGWSLVSDPGLFFNMDGIICMPLPFVEGNRGVLWVGRTEAFLAEDIDLVAITASLAMSELSKARLIELYTMQARRIAAIRRIDLAIKESMDLKLALGVVLDQVLHQLDVDLADILILYPDSVMLETAVHRGMNGEAVHRRRIRLGQSIPGRIALERRPTLIPDIGEPEMPTPWESLMKEFGIVGYYGVPLVARGAIKGVLELYTHTSLRPNEDWERILNTFADQAAIAIDKSELFEKWQRSEAALDMSNDSTLMTLSKALNLRDHYSREPSQKMIDRTIQLARNMGVLEESLVQIRRGVILHDIGKLGVPDNILSKAGPLTDQEWAEIRRHPEYAFEILSPNPQLASAVDIPYCHHERWDGSGYPRGLEKEEIPLAARIFAVVDVWVSMTSRRPYRPPHTEEETRRFIRENAGNLFDPKVVENFLLTVV